MMSLGKITTVAGIALLLSACGSGETTSNETAGNPGNGNGNGNPHKHNRAPVISGTPGVKASVGAQYGFIPSASDPDGDTLSFTASNLPGWASIDQSNGEIAGMPAATDLGTYSDIVVSVSDGTDSASLPPFAITVYDYSNLKTVSTKISSGMDDVEEQADGAMYVDSSDLELIYDGENQLVGLRFVLPVPPNSVITQANLRFTTDEATSGATDLEIWAEATDDAAAFSSNIRNVSSRASTVNTSNWVPAPWNSVSESGAPQTTSDLSAVIQEVVDRSGWKENNHLVLVISGSGVRTAVSYDGDAASSAVLTVAYSGGADNNRAPTISGTPSSGATEGYAYSFTPTASDPDGDLLVFSIANKPEWATFDVNTGALAGTPVLGYAGSYDNITISVSDGELSDSLEPFSIVVSDSNRAPTIAGTPVASVAEGAVYSFTPTASDADGDSLAFSISNKPAWASFDTSTGNLSGTPGYSDAGTYSTIVISVSDGIASSSLGPFNITVANSNRLPTISGTPAASVAENGSYGFTPTASDADGDHLTFSVANLPAWASFNAASGALSGTPGYDAAGTYGNIVISVNDGVASVSLTAFSITVTNVNQAPVISGTPSSSVKAGASYAFTPSASDGDGDGLTFSISGQPSWATFDSATGRLTGTPQEADVGEYSGISIRVSDGTQEASLATFSITVETSTVAKGSIRLNWVAPTTRTDGASLDLSEIGGYVVYLGTSSSNMSKQVELSDSSATSYVIEDLDLGTYFVAITAYDMDGNVSSYSNIVEKIVTN